jgi:hypothetical protein
MKLPLTCTAVFACLVLRFAGCAALICLVPAASIAGEPSEKLFSPDKRYSVEILRNSEQGLLVRQSGKTLTKISTPVGPADSSFEALWSSDDRYVAVNKQRSSRPGGDEMWIIALPSGHVVRKPEDSLWNDLEEKAGAFIDEKHLSETGKVFLTLTAIGWEKNRLHFRLEAGFSQVEDRYLFDGSLDPAIYAEGQGVTFYTPKESEPERNSNKPADSAIKQKLLGYWKFPKAVCYIAADGKMYVGPQKNETEASRWNVKNGKFYWGNVPYTIVTLTDNKFVFQEIGGQKETFTLIRSTKEEVGPE